MGQPHKNKSRLARFRGTWWPVYATTTRNHFFSTKFSWEAGLWPLPFEPSFHLVVWKKVDAFKNSLEWCLRDPNLSRLPLSCCAWIFFDNLPYSLNYSFVHNWTWPATSWKVTYWIFTLKTWRISHSVKATIYLLGLNYWTFVLVEKFHYLCLLFSHVFYIIHFQSLLYIIPKRKIIRVNKQQNY